MPWKTLEDGRRVFIEPKKPKLVPDKSSKRYKARSELKKEMHDKKSKAMKEIVKENIDNPNLTINHKIINSYWDCLPQSERKEILELISDDMEDLFKKIDKIEARLEEKQEELDETEKELEALDIAIKHDEYMNDDELEDMEEDYDELGEEYDELVADVEDLQDDLNTLNAEVEVLERSINLNWDLLDMDVKMLLLDNIEVIDEMHKERTLNDMIEGGFADDIPDSVFDSEQLKKGTEVEMEHTNDPKIAREIATDHLMEHPDYYDYLEEAEKKMEKNLEIPEYQEYKIKGKKFLYKKNSVHRTKEGATMMAKETRKDGFKARVKKIGNQFVVYYFN